MKFTFMFFVLIHGIIHLLGFFKAFHLLRIDDLSLDIGKFPGIFWLIVSLIFVVSAIQFIMENEFWWVFATIGISISQILIFMFWRDAKIGTIPNLIILFAVIFVFANWNFNRITNSEISKLFTINGKYSNSIVAKSDLVNLPVSLQKWIMSSGLLGTEKVRTVRLKQKSIMKMKPEDMDWTEGTALQYYTIEDPAFIWTINMKLYGFIDIVGRDSFIDGKGKMLIKLFSLINLVNENGHKIDTGALQRFLGEIVWFPSAALSPYIKWEEIDSLSARATMNYHGTEGSGVFYFNENGDFKKFIALRYMGNEENSEQKEWTVTADKIEEVNGIRIPTRMKATWRLENGDWTWLKITIEEIKYNLN